MRRQKSNLKNSRGASIIIAMVFMLFCVFVGGSVLTAATVNAYRVKNLSKQQQKLNEESAVLFLADSIRKGDDQLQLTISQREVRKQPVHIDADGTVTETAPKLDPERIIDINVSGNNELTVPQRILLESAIRKHLIGNTVPADKITIRNFKWNNPDPDGSKVIAGIGSFWVGKQVDTPFTYSFKIGSDDLFPGNDYQVDFVCNSGYDMKINVHFPDKDGNLVLSSMSVKMSASKSEKKLTPETEVIKNASDPTTGYKVTTIKSITTLSWTTPKIVKEGE